MSNDFLNWMSKNTVTNWCNDSVVDEDVDKALKSGAVGCTSNPPLTYSAIVQNPERYMDDINNIPHSIKGDDRVIEIIGIVVRRISKKLMPIYENTNGKYGYIRAQVIPSKSNDADAMLEMAKKFASWGDNIMVKIPVTKAGIQVIEELTAMSVAVTPTVCPTVSHILQAARSHERGIERAKSAGKKIKPSTAAFVIGRLQDYLKIINDKRCIGLSDYELNCASLAAAKKAYKLIEKSEWQTKLMPAAFRSTWQIEQLTGSDTIMTIHPKVQNMLDEEDSKVRLARKININETVDSSVIDKVLYLAPEFALAFEEDAISIDELDEYGAVKMTLKNFDQTGWQKLRKL